MSKKIFAANDELYKSTTADLTSNLSEHDALKTHTKSETSYTEASASISSLLLPSFPSKGIEKHRLARPFLSGWRIGALVSLIAATSAFILNLVLTIWILKNSKIEVCDGIGTLFVGSCAKTRRLNIWAQLLVNVLSTSLLSASNYCMQVLCAPNREEIDRAHARRVWLHIGIPSLHNLRHIKTERAFLWTILMLSSLPLHLLYNSVVFTNLQANSYAVVPTMENWLSGGPYNFTNFLGYKNTSDFEAILNQYRPRLSESIILSNGTTVPRYRNTSTVDCFHTFDEQYTCDHGNVYVIQDNPTTWHDQTVWHLGVHNETGQYLWYVNNERNAKLAFYNRTVRRVESSVPFYSEPKTYPSNGWRCPPLRNSTCDFPNAAEDWKPYESSVRYCVIEQTLEICKLQFSFRIMSIVLVSNLIKAACIARLLFFHRNHGALVTLGDALASFLERSDVHTEGRCLASEVEIDRVFDERTFVAPQNEIVRYLNRHTTQLENQIRNFKPREIRWVAALSYGTWLTAYAFYAICAVFGSVAIALSLRNMPKSLAQLWKIRFGSVDGRNLLTTKMSLIGVAILANSPQTILSCLYISFNRLYTGMLLGKEWSSYLHERKSLRVTTPVGEQRSTYWLSMPYRYGVPAMVVSGLLHWLASQSLFMVQTTVTRTEKNGPRVVMPDEQISTCGFSPIAIIFTTVLVTMIAISGFVMSRFKYPAGMPLASSCSAVMSAACHPPAGDTNAYMLPVQWGAVVYGSSVYDHDNKWIGHCTFSSQLVEMPVPDRAYS